MMATRDTIRCGKARGFTLVEIIIVLGLIILIASIAIPSISTMFNAGADVQAHNLLAGQLAAARAGAVLESTYWAVHMQMGADSDDSDDDPELSGVCYSAVMKLKRDSGIAIGGDNRSLTATGQGWTSNEWAGSIVEITTGTGSGQWGWVASNTPDSLTLKDGWENGSDPPDVTSIFRVYRFELAKGYAPSRVPGTMAFGQVTNEAGETGNNYSYFNNAGEDYVAMDDDALKDFTTLTIIFSPRGEVVTRLYNIDLDDFEIPFGTEKNDPLFKIDTKVWNVPETPEHGVSAVTLFNYGKLNAMSEDGRADYLNEYGQFLPINTYSGRLFPRK